MSKLFLWARISNYTPRKTVCIDSLVPGDVISEIPGGRLNKKDGLTRYGNSHVKDKTS